MDYRTRALLPVVRYRVIKIRGRGKQNWKTDGRTQQQQTKGLFGLVHAVHRFTDLAVRGHSLLAIKLSPLTLRNLCLGCFYRAVLISGDAKSALALATVIDYFCLIPRAVTAPVKPLSGRQFLFTFLDELQPPRPPRPLPLAHFFLHAYFIHIGQQWLIAFHFLIGPLRCSFVRRNYHRVQIHPDLSS